MTTITLEVTLTPAKEQELQHRIAYFLLYTLAAAVDERLKRGHLRDCRGRVLLRFDEWLRAAESGEWPVSDCANDPAKHEFTEEYYGLRCKKCDQFIPYGSEPWTPPDDYEEEDYHGTCETCGGEWGDGWSTCVCDDDGFDDGEPDFSYYPEDDGLDDWENKYG